MKQLSPALLTKAVFRAVEQLNLSLQLPALLGVSAEDVARLQTGDRMLDPHGHEWQRALHVVSLFRTSVEVLGSVERARAWLATPNETLGGPPAEILGTSEAERVYRYLDSVHKHELRMPPAIRREH